MGVNARQFPLIFILHKTVFFVLWACCVQISPARVLELPIETKVEPALLEPELCSSQSVKVPMITMRLHEGEHPSLQFPLLSRRYSRMFLAVHEQTRNQLIDRVLLEMQLRLTASGETHRWNRESMIPGIRERMALASHKEIGRGRKWMAHLQRADFEVLAKGLSLSDINRYQFRRNRPHSEGIPVFQAGGGD